MLLRLPRARGLAAMFIPFVLPLILAAFSASNERRVRAAQDWAEMGAIEDRSFDAPTDAAVHAVRRSQWVIGFSILFGLVGGVVAAFGFSSSGTPRIDRMRELEDAREELDQFFSLSLDMLCIADAGGRFLRVNLAWQKVLGWTSAELTSVPYLEFVHPDDLASTTAAARQLVEGVPVISFENRYRCRDGSYRWLDWKAVPLPRRGIVYAIARDVTEQKQVACDLQAHAAALRDANEELEAFSYSVSHDLRAPLRHISGFASLLSHHLRGTDDEAQRYLKTIEDAAARMGRLIDDLLSFSRMGRTTLTKRRISLEAIVRDAQREATSNATDRDIQWTVDPLPSVDADPAMLHLVFVNLLSNAVKYTATRPQARIEIGANGGHSGETVVYVRDNGVGFDMQYAHKLFGVFQRLHSADEFEGTGIGLATVRRIIHRHGGRTWAEGTPNEGATFYLSLPDEGIREEPGDVTRRVQV